MWELSFFSCDAFPCGKGRERGRGVMMLSTCIGGEKGKGSKCERGVSFLMNIRGSVRAREVTWQGKEEEVEEGEQGPQKFE